MWTIWMWVSVLCCEVHRPRAGWAAFQGRQGFIRFDFNLISALMSYNHKVGPYRLCEPFWCGSRLYVVKCTGLVGLFFKVRQGSKRFDLNYYLNFLNLNLMLVQSWHQAYDHKVGPLRLCEPFGCGSPSYVVKCIRLVGLFFNVGKSLQGLIWTKKNWTLCRFNSKVDTRQGLTFLALWTIWMWVSLYVVKCTGLVGLLF